MTQGRRRDRAKEQLWRRRIQRWRASGLSVSEFCRQHDLVAANFHAWRRTLQQRGNSAAFVPVRIVESEGAKDASRPTGLEVVAANGHVVRVGTNFDPATLRRLLAVLAEGQP